MWNDILAARAATYATGVLTVLDPAGYPFSMRVTVTVDNAAQQFVVAAAFPFAATGRACLLFHRHDAGLENQCELMIKGDLSADGDRLVFRPSGFLTGTGSDKTDRMPHASNPVQLIQFMLLGRRKEREYLAKRGRPWPVDFKGILRALNE